jgi:hypothetical protein
VCGKEEETEEVLHINCKNGTNARKREKKHVIEIFYVTQQEG